MASKNLAAIFVTSCVYDLGSFGKEILEVNLCNFA